MDAIEVIIQRAQFTHWIFKLRAKQEHFNVRIIFYLLIFFSPLIRYN